MPTVPIFVNPELVRRIQMEFLEMPGLRLTSRQARRLWALDEATCDRILTVLVEEQFLSRTREGAYLRSGSGRLRRPDAA